MSKFLKWCSIIIGILGLITAWTLANKAGTVPYFRFNWDAALPVFFLYAISTLSASVVMFWMGDVVGHLSDISDYLKASLADKLQTSSIYNNENSWTCSKCNTQNFKYSTTCNCGQHIHQN